MKLNVGSRLESQACSTEIIVVRSPGRDDVIVTCGGKPMVPLGTGGHSAATIEPGDGAVLGKRYVSSRDERLEVLVTKAGAGSLGDGQLPLVAKAANAMPSSD